MNWMELAIGFAAGCAYSQTVAALVAWLDRREARRQQGAGE
ncbi:hypothetical protein [Listeria seeligeri]|nr:hypothetical protein [Listeria seeligeri]